MTKKPTTTAKKASAKTEKKPISLLARYDAATTDRMNAKHWSWADFKSADLDANRITRKTLRIRARYETQNNSYAAGIAKTISADTIGSGPHLQVVGEDKISEKIEKDFAAWSKAVGLVEKLRTARFSKLVDGEAFLLLTTNEAIENQIKLDVQLIDADRVTDYNAEGVEGIELDDKGNVVKYRILNSHPSEGFGREADEVDACFVVHLFDSLRAGQHRGVSELAPCLDLFGQLRDYTRSVLTAAQTAACLTGVIETDAPAGGESEEIVPMEAIELAQGQLLTMPAGWKLAMTKAEQPTATYAEFKAEILGEICRCLGVPFNIGIGNSNDASYASSRLDWQIYHKAIKLQQKMFADKALDRIFKLWFTEWQLKNGGKFKPEWSWIFDGINEHSDPYKQAHADQLELHNLTTSLATVYASKGKNWEVELAQIAREKEVMKKLNLTMGEVQEFIDFDDEEEDKKSKDKGGK